MHSAVFISFHLYNIQRGSSSAAADFQGASHFTGNEINK